jgi:PAS domain S-box-containing protein
VARDGSLRRVAWSTTALCDSDGQITYVVSTGIDVTDARHGEAALADSERAFRTLADNSTDVITRMTLSGLLVYVSPSVESVLGHAPSDLVNRSAAEIVHADDWASFAKTLEAAEEGVTIPSVFRAVRSDGTYAWCESSSRIRRDPITGEMEVQASTRDISDRRQVEELYRTLVELCPDALLVYDEHEIRYANQSAAELFGVSRPEDLLGIDPASFIRPEQREEASARDRSIMVEGRRVHGFERTCVRSDGLTVELESSAGPLQVGNRTVVMAILRDVTERRRAQASVETSEHRLRTSLDALLDGFADYEAVRNTRGDIVDSASSTSTRPGSSRGVSPRSR